MSQQPVQNVSPEAVEFLYKAIDDTQNTIRFTDTKAGVVIVTGGIIAGYYLQLIIPVLNHFRKPEMWIWSIVAAIGLFCVVAVILTILASLSAIRPISNASKHINPDGITTKLPFSISEVRKLGLSDLLWEKRKSILSVSAQDIWLNASDESVGSEIAKSLVLELLKLSYIRDKKIYRTTRAIAWLVTSMFLVLVFAMAQRIVGLI